MRRIPRRCVLFSLMIAVALILAASSFSGSGQAGAYRVETTSWTTITSFTTTSSTIETGTEIQTITIIGVVVVAALATVAALSRFVRKPSLTLPTKPASQLPGGSEGRFFHEGYSEDTPNPEEPNSPRDMSMDAMARRWTRMGMDPALEPPEFVSVPSARGLRGAEGSARGPEGARSGESGWRGAPRGEGGGMGREGGAPEGSSRIGGSQAEGPVSGEGGGEPVRSAWGNRGLVQRSGRSGSGGSDWSGTLRGGGGGGSVSQGGSEVGGHSQEASGPISSPPGGGSEAKAPSSDANTPERSSQPFTPYQVAGPVVAGSSSEESEPDVSPTGHPPSETRAAQPAAEEDGFFPPATHPPQEKTVIPSTKDETSAKLITPVPPPLVIGDDQAPSGEAYWRRHATNPPPAEKPEGKPSPPSPDFKATCRKIASYLTFPAGPSGFTLIAAFMGRAYGGSNKGRQWLVGTVIPLLAAAGFAACGSQVRFRAIADDPPRDDFEIVNEFEPARFNLKRPANHFERTWQDYATKNVHLATALRALLVSWERRDGVKAQLEKWSTRPGRWAVTDLRKLGMAQSEAVRHNAEASAQLVGELLALRRRMNMAWQQLVEKLGGAESYPASLTSHELAIKVQEICKTNMRSFQVSYRLSDSDMKEIMATIDQVIEQLRRQGASLKLPDLVLGEPWVECMEAVSRQLREMALTHERQDRI